MPRKPRIHTRPGALVEIVNRTIQRRYLIKPGPRMNALIVGALAKAQQRHAVDIHGGAFLSGHFHLLLSCQTVRDQAGFMRDFTRKLSLESGKLYDWEDPTFTKRYRCTQLSDEAEAQVARLAYCLSHGAKENLVHSPLDWPGVPFAEALITGEPLQGIWIDRTAYCRALDRGEDVTLDDFTEHLSLKIKPLPCHQHLGRDQWRSMALELVRKIEEDTAARHRAEGMAPLGVDAVLNADPHDRPSEARASKPEPTPKPLFHAFTQRAWHEMREALSLILAAYRDAAERLKSGNLTVDFPENTFPPARSFIEPMGSMKSFSLKTLSPELLQPG